MRRWLRCLIAIGVLAVLGWSANAATVSGRVVDLGRQRSGIPAVEVRLQTYGEEKAEFTAYTDAEGRFKFKIVDTPRPPRAKLTAARRGWQKYPTTKIVSLNQDDAVDLNMVSEGGTPTYYRSFASEILKLEPTERSELRAIWFTLPAHDMEIVSQEFAALGGEPEGEHALYAAEHNRKKERDRDVSVYANGTTERSTGSTSVNSTTDSSTSMTSSSHHRRARKD